MIYKHATNTLPCILTSRRSLTMFLFLLFMTCTTLTSSLQLNVRKKSRAARSTFEKPEIVERPQSQKVHVNQWAKFVCRVKGNSPVIITWWKHERKLSDRPGSILLGNDSLMLLHVQKSDDGIYKCIAKNGVGTSSSEATLIVLDPLIVPVITQLTTNQTISEGQRITFTCKATGNPQPKIIWKISVGSPSDRLERPSPDSIRIPKATPRDSGKYSCIAINKEGNDTRAVYLNVFGYPVFIESPPLNLAVRENATVSLNCKVIGSPTPDVRWYYGSKLTNQDTKTVVLKNKTLIIWRVKFEDAGTYTCVANNSAGLRRSKSTLLQVKSRPRLSCCLNNNGIVRNRTVIDGKHISLDCSAVGYPEPKYDWRFNNITMLESQSALYAIPKVSKDSEGVYCCRAYNNLGSLLVKIFLSVLIPPRVAVKPKRKIVLPGASAEFMCIVTGDPIPTIRWYSSKGVISHNSSLIISNITVNDQGEYWCEGQSTVGRNVAKGTIVVAVQPTFVVVPPRNITANETSSVRVRCSAKGPDQPIINWFRLTTRGGKKINISNSEIISLNPDSLKISQLARDDGGFYLCEAKNLAGLINTTFFLNIQYRPRLILSGQHIITKAGETASLYCPVEANPAAQIRWIYPVDFNSFRLSGSHIVIPIVKLSDGGNYTCNAVNLLGTLQTSVEVTVLTSPRIVGLKRVKKLNEWISLTCETEGIPQPTVRWLDQTPLPGGSFSVDNLGNLRMEKRFISTMKFVCNASNAHGWTTKYVKTPSSPYQLNIVRTTSTSVTFSWLANKSEIISDFEVERLSKADSNWITVNSSVTFSMFSDQGLQPFTWFLFRVRGKNALGKSGPSNILNITTREGVPSRPTNIVVVSRELTSITVEWKPPKEPRGLFTNIFYEVYYMEHGSLFDDKMKLNYSSVMYRLKIANLKSYTWYVIKVRAGRQSNNASVVHWSGYTLVETNTLQEAPVIPPEIIKVMSNGPRRIFVSWKRPVNYVKGYHLLYKKYESINLRNVTINSWNTTNHMITGLDANQLYEIQLRMFTSGGYGPWSYPANVIRTDQDKLASPGTSSSFSDGLTWKIALGGALLAVIILLLLLVYVYLARKYKNNDSDKKNGIKSRKNNGYDFDDGSRVSNESEGSIEGMYNLNVEDDIDLSMFDTVGSHDAPATDSNLYIENPFLSPDHLKLDDSYQAVRLATFATRPSPFGTPAGSKRLTNQNLSSSEMSSHNPDVVEPVVYAKLDLSAKARSRNSLADTSEEITDDILI